MRGVPGSAQNPGALLRHPLLARLTDFAAQDVIPRAQRAYGSARESFEDATVRVLGSDFDARIDGLWRVTQRCVTEAEATGLPSPMGSGVKLGYSELGQEITKLGMTLLGRRALGNDGPDTTEALVVHDYLWSFQNTIAAGTSQIQRNLVAQRILGLPT